MMENPCLLIMKKNFKCDDRVQIVRTTSDLDGQFI